MDRNQLLPHEALLVLLVRCAFCGKTEVASATAEACSAEASSAATAASAEVSAAAIAAACSAEAACCPVTAAAIAAACSAEAAWCPVTAASAAAIAAACSAEDWTRMVDLAFENGVAALAADGYHVLLEQCPEAVALMETEQMEDLRYDWFGSMLQTEEEYAYKLKKASKFAAALAKRGVECKVLKGLSFAMYYDRPEHRECGDCDVYLGKDFEVGNQVVVELGGSCDGAPGKHCHLYLGSLMIENHRHLTDLHGTRQEMKTERLLEAVLAESDVPAPSAGVSAGATVPASAGADMPAPAAVAVAAGVPAPSAGVSAGATVPASASAGATVPAGGLRKIGSTQLLRPSDHFNALFLIQHAYANFIFMGMSLRMVYDWAMLLKRCRETLDFARLCHDLDECRLLPFARVMTAICVDYLGLELTCPEQGRHESADRESGCHESAGSESAAIESGGPELLWSPELGCDRDKALAQKVLKDILSGGIITRGEETLWKKVVRISRRIVRFWRYRRLATESVPRLIWNNLIYNSYTHIRCDYEE